jgi:adenine-specific DNA-methyltransferase
MEKMNGESKNIVAENIEKIKELFPEVFAENKINFERLQETLGEHVEDKDERYRFEWHGKSKAIRLAQTSSTGTLRPCKEESKNWDTTENLYIEGDNLEVLKLLQKTYNNRIKMIYIDPPYNTGNDFVYPDNYRDNIKNYLELTGQTDEEGNKVSSNSESSGRYHTDWLNMMYPRLRLSRNLLSDDGVIFVSIDDNEVFNLKKICDEIFGEERFISNFIWKSRQNKDNRNVTGVSVDHEYVLCYGKKVRGGLRNNDQYKNPDNDSRGPWTSANMVGLLPEDQRPNCHYNLVNPATGTEYKKHKMGWRYDKNTMNKLIGEDRIIWPKSVDGRPRRKVFLSELNDQFTGFSSIVGENIYTRTGTQEIEKIFGERPFQFPKASEFIKEFVVQGCDDKEAIVLDFFAGSSTTAQAVVQLNIEDLGKRKFILVQLPEKLDMNSEAYKNGYRSISEVGLERIRRVCVNLSKENEKLINEQEIDIGFKVFKLDSSNLKKWNPDYDNLEISLDDMVSNYVEGRTEEDVLYEIMLKYGVDLTYPIETEMVEGKKVFSVGFGSLFICLSDNIDSTIAEYISNRKSELGPEITRVVFKDNGFINDSAKTNMIQILKRNGIDEIVSV